MTSRPKSFVAALVSGQMALHPTDTLPGLTFHPSHAGGLEALRAWKGREVTKTFIGLCADAPSAFSFWDDLPDLWRERLGRVWPAPLSVIWPAAAQAPAALRAQDGTIALRVPRLENGTTWLLEAMKLLALPLPTTSVNRSGMPPAKTWREAVRMVEASPDIFIPQWTPDVEFASVPPSTLVRLAPNGDWKVEREGAVTASQLLKAWKNR